MIVAEILGLIWSEAVAVTVRAFLVVERDPFGGRQRKSDHAVK